MKNRPRQDDLFPGKSVVLEQALANDEADMQMDMDEAAAGLIVTQKAQY
jgi:hypothetical protein